MKRTAIASLLSFGSLLHAGDLAYKLYLPDREHNLADRKVELIGRCMEAYHLPPLLLPRAASDEEFAENMIREFRKSMLGLGVDPEKILKSLDDRDWVGAGPEMEDAVEEHQLIFDDSVQLRQPVGGVGEIRVFVITRGFCWQKGKVLVDDTRAADGGENAGQDVGDFVGNVLLKVPRIAEMLKSQHALVAIGTASAELGGDGVAKEELRAGERSQELARALAHTHGITCPVFTSNWGRYDQKEPDRASQREIVILGLVKCDDASGVDLGNADLRGLMASFSAKQRGQQLDPSKYSGLDKDPKRYVDGQ